jgi:hypothetical protein
MRPTWVTRVRRVTRAWRYAEALSASSDCQRSAPRRAVRLERPVARCGPRRTAPVGHAGWKATPGGAFCVVGLPAPRTSARRSTRAARRALRPAKDGHPLFSSAESVNDAAPRCCPGPLGHAGLEGSPGNGFASSELPSPRTSARSSTEDVASRVAGPRTTAILTFHPPSTSTMNGARLSTTGSGCSAYASRAPSRGPRGSRGSRGPGGHAGRPFAASDWRVPAPRRAVD